MRTSPAAGRGSGVSRTSSTRGGGPFRAMKPCLIGPPLREPRPAWQAPAVRSTRLALTCALGASVACASVVPRPSSTPVTELPLAARTQAPSGSFELRYTSYDAGEVLQMQAALLAAAAPLAR